ncbi:glycoside hydrolase family 79 protein [Fomitopsis serialis]|uniref:glycoside hydrolase family 79 protein n=1 Tax=Fomitopsis serialis TaxID=139415 RepID=UPI0020079E53|nr:glycoside hydrolase family 79 protein [Neoantrodia serialis]KAH9929433.1 glycoside hydrolase family 79 protein [Neoantrodia serialis]
MRPYLFRAATLLSLASLWSFPLACCSAITAYNVQGPLTIGSATSTSDTAAGTAVYDPPYGSYSGYAAYNPIVLAPPAVPSNLSTQYDLVLPGSASGVQGLSIPQSGSFLGFSVEMSVATEVSNSFLQVPFLNLMQLVAQRGGSVNVRVGGNTQDYAVEVTGLSDNRGICVKKDIDDTRNPTNTPTLLFTPELLYMLSNVSALINVNWWLGIPFNDTSNWRLDIAETGEAILGDRLLGFQVGNEPDLYALHGHRAANYSVWDYFGEFAEIVEAIAADDNIPMRNNLIAPSVSGTWTPEDVWNTGFLTSYDSSLGALAVEKYPDDNCAALYPGGDFGPAKDPQGVFANYLNHTSGQLLVKPYLASTALAQQNGKPFYMFETNTASCGGFPGVSDSFGAALWAADYALQMAYSNFSAANLHVGGLSDSYNPFIPPPTNESLFQGWTIGPVFYSVLAVAEALGSSNTSRVIDLNANNGSIYTPAYAIYENNALARLALFNYVSDASGASNVTATISIDGGRMGEQVSTPQTVKIKYLAAESVAVKENITWAGQTLGSRFEVDGRLKGGENVQTVQCDTSSDTCQVNVPAPGLALVFLSDTAYEEVEPSSVVTFATTSVTNPLVTVTVNPSVLSTSNGNGSIVLGATDHSSRAVPRGSVGVGLSVLLAAATSFVLLKRMV